MNHSIFQAPFFIISDYRTVIKYFTQH